MIQRSFFILLFLNFITVLRAWPGGEGDGEHQLGEEQAAKQTHLRQLRESGSNLTGKNISVLQPRASGTTAITEIEEKKETDPLVDKDDEVIDNQRIKEAKDEYQQRINYLASRAAFRPGLLMCSDIKKAEAKFQ